MATPQLGYVQVAPDGTGKRVANVQLVDAILPDGTVQQLYAQMVVPVDGEGDVIDFDDAGHKAAVLERLDTIISLLSQLVT